MPHQGAKADFLADKDAFRLWVEQNFKTEAQAPASPEPPSAGQRDSSFAGVGPQPNRQEGRESRSRVIRWVKEEQHVFRLLPAILDKPDLVKALVRALQHECEALRRENEHLCRKMADLRRERDEIVNAFNTLMQEILRSMNELTKKTPADQKSLRAPGPGCSADPSGSPSTAAPSIPVGRPEASPLP